MISTFFDNLDCKHARFERDRWSRGSCCCYSSRLRRLRQSCGDSRNSQYGRGSLESLRYSQALCDYNKLSKLSISLKNLKMFWISHITVNRCHSSKKGTMRLHSVSLILFFRYSCQRNHQRWREGIGQGKIFPCCSALLQSQRLHWSYTLSHCVKRNPWKDSDVTISEGLATNPQPAGI